jgi:hypothetical protein
MKYLLVSELIGTDRILTRWAVSVGDGLRDQPWQEVTRSQVPVLNDQVAIVVDQLILRSPPRTRELTELWYRTPLPREALAKKLHVHRDTLYVRWNAALHYFRGRFESSPLSELRRLCLTDIANNSTPEYKGQVDWAKCAHTA